MVPEPHPRGAADRLTVLLLYRKPLSRWYGEAGNVDQNVASFARHSRFPVETYNAEQGFPRGLRDVRPDAVILHYTMFGEGPGRYPFSPLFDRWLDASSDTYVVATFQDEHHWCRKRFEFLESHRIDCVFTMLEEPWGEQVYGGRGSVSRVVSHLPGYVGPELVEASARFARPLGERTIDVSYRGRPTPPYMGRGAAEKHEIGPRFAEAAEGSGLALDVSVAEEDRVYGEDWFRLLAGSRATLGVESGASFVDLEDEVRLEYEALVAEGRDPTIEDLEAGALGRWEGNVPYRTISPRQFEAAAFGVGQVLYEGSYSGLLEPMRHYIPLKKDLSNAAEAIERIRDASLLQELTRNARADLIDSGHHSYERFVRERFDPVLEEAGVSVDGGSPAAGVTRAALKRSAPALALERTRSTLSYHPVLSRLLWRVSRPVLGAVRWLRSRRHRAD